jgi:hypothetical protein
LKQRRRVDEQDKSLPPAVAIKSVRKHLLKAQRLIEAIDPLSIAGARLELRINELDEEFGAAATNELRQRTR